MINLRLPFSQPRRLPFYLAMEEWAARCLPENDYFFSWRVHPTVICGRNQEMDKEVNMDYCRREGIDVVRRKSGGGCVYADMDNFMFSYICPGDEITATFARYTTMIATLLRRIGLDAAATGRNDIVVGGRKISGNAFYHLPGRCLAHGTMLYDFDAAAMSRAITPSRAKLESKSVKSVPARITCLKAEGIALSPEEFERYIVGELCENEIVPDAAAIAAIEKIEQSYYEPAFLYRKGENTPSAADDRGQTRLHAHVDGVGEIEICIACDTEGRIVRTEASGDFFLLDDPGRTIFSALKGVEFTPGALREALRHTDPAKTIAGLDRDKLLAILTQH